MKKIGLILRDCWAGLSLRDKIASLNIEALNDSLYVASTMKKIV